MECTVLNQPYRTELAVTHYRIALNFQGSKFSRIEIFEEFVEIISRIRCMRTLHTVCQKISVEIFSRTVENSRNSRN